MNHVAGLGHPKYADRRDATVIFADDYVGTGETALKALNAYEAEQMKADDRAIAVCFVALRSGYNELSDRFRHVFASIVRDRGISDAPSITNKDAAREIMREIEDRLSVEADYRFGYLGSEGLETMQRTPDNTFPIFWHAGADAARPWPAPFPRKDG